MLASVQDEDLAPIYVGLPDLGYVFFIYRPFLLLNLILSSVYRSVKQFSYVTSVGMGVVTMKDIEPLHGIDVVPFVTLFNSLVQC